VKCREKIPGAFNQRDRAASLRFHYAQRPAFIPAWQRPAFRVDVFPRSAIKPTRFHDQAHLIRYEPCAETFERRESKNASGACHLQRFKRKAAQRSESL
jgi:hypothetical protein